MSGITRSPYVEIHEAIIAGDLERAKAVARTHPYDPTLQLTLEMWEKLK